jgi:hypothetical protein
VGKVKTKKEKVETKKARAAKKEPALVSERRLRRLATAGSRPAA